MRGLRTLPLLLAVCLVAVACDQVTKFWAVEELTRAFELESAETLGEKLRAYRVMRHLESVRQPAIVVVEGFWRFRYLENPGAAWGMLGSLDPSLRLPFFRIVPLLAAAVLSFLYFRASPQQRLLRLSLAAIVGGALGNFIDRWIHGYVVDFVEWRFGSYQWPTFNVADVFISVGIAGVVLEGLRSSWRRRRLARERARAAEAELRALETIVQWGERAPAEPDDDIPIVLDEAFEAWAERSATPPIASDPGAEGESGPDSGEASERARND